VIKLSLKGLAKFMTSGPAAQRKILRDFKYPDPEGHAQAMYYREARDFIVAHHKSGHGAAWLHAQAGSLAGLAKLSAGQTRVRLAHNARALAQYADSFAEKKWKLLDPVRFQLMFGSVRVSVSPDLHVAEKSKERLVKLEFSEDDPDPKVIAILSQAIFQAAQASNVPVSASGVLVLDVPRGEAHKGARMGSRLAQDLEAACDTIEAVWGRI